jgi:hypothetical protein
MMPDAALAGRTEELLAVVAQLAYRLADILERYVRILLAEARCDLGAQRRASSLSVLTSRLR